jgi:enoyl-CoA hydratase/carnithine racemase
MPVLDMTVSDAIAVVTLSRPQARNALSPELIVRLAKCWETLKQDGGVRVVVLDRRAGFDVLRRLRPRQDDPLDDRIA